MEGEHTVEFYLLPERETSPSEESAFMSQVATDNNTPASDQEPNQPLEGEGSDIQQNPTEEEERAPLPPLKKILATFRFPTRLEGGSPLASQLAQQLILRTFISLFKVSLIPISTYLLPV